MSENVNTAAVEASATSATAARPLCLDRVGAFASLACAVHCALLPVAFGLGAAGAVSFLDHRPVEWGLVGLAAVVGTTASVRGYRKHGRLWVSLLLAGTVVALVGLSLLHLDHDHAHEGVTGWLFAGLGFLLAFSHVVNRRLCRACGGCRAHHVPHG